MYSFDTKDLIYKFELDLILNDDRDKILFFGINLCDEMYFLDADKDELETFELNEKQKFFKKIWEKNSIFTFYKNNIPFSFKYIFLSDINKTLYDFFKNILDSEYKIRIEENDNNIDDINIIYQYGHDNKIFWQNKFYF